MSNERRYGEARKSLWKAKQRWADHISELEASANEGQAQKIASDNSDSDGPRSRRTASQNDSAKSEKHEKKGQTDSSERADSNLTKGCDSNDEASASECARAVEAAAERAARARAEGLEASACVSMWACHVALCEGDLIAAEAALLLAVESEEEETRARADSVVGTETESTEAGRDVRVTVVGSGTTSEATSAVESVPPATENGTAPALPGGSSVDTQTTTPIQPQPGEVTSHSVDYTGANGAPVGLTQKTSEQAPVGTAGDSAKRFPQSPILLGLMGTLSFHKMEYRDAHECFVRAGGGDCEVLLAGLGCGGVPEPVAQAPPAKPKSALGKSPTKKGLGKSPSKKPVKKEKKLERGPGAYSFRAFGIETPRTGPSEVGGSTGVETVTLRRTDPRQTQAKQSAEYDGGLAKDVSVLNNVGACYLVLRDR